VRPVEGSYRTALRHRRWWLLVGTCLVLFLAAHLGAVYLMPKWVATAAQRVYPLAFVSGAAAALLVLVWGWLDLRRDAAAAERLRESEARLDLLMHQAPANVWTTDMELRLTSVFGALIADLENPQARVPGCTLYDLFQTRDESHPAIAAHLRALRGESATYERMVGDRCLEGAVEPLHDNQGRLIGCVGTAMDVSSWRWAESEVRRYGALVQSSEDAIISTDLAGTIETWNPAAERLYGFTAAEAIGRPMTIVAPPGGASEIERNILALRQGAAVGPYDTQRLCRDGRMIDVSVTVSPIRDERGHVLGASGIVRDITERKRTEEALHRSEEMFRLLAENATDIVSRHAPDGTFLYVSHACRRLLGYEPEELVGRSAHEFMHPDDAAAVRLPRDPVARYSATFRYRRKDGTYAWFESLGRAVPEETTGAVTEFHAVSRDVTERRRAEEAVRPRTERRRAGRLLQRLFARDDRLVAK
jgi:PAS domain S-box-containing protein